MKYQRKIGLNNALIVLAVIVVLCSCLILNTLAWLQETYIFNEDRNKIGYVNVSLYSNNTKIEGSVDENGKWTSNSPIAIPAGSIVRALNLKVRNEGNIDTLVRATISIYYLEDAGNGNTNKRTALVVSDAPTNLGTISIDSSNWIRQFPSATAACGYMFYNSRLVSYSTRTPNSSDAVDTSVDTNGEVNVINQIAVSESQKNVIFYIDISVDAVAYSGNIYKKIENNETTIADIPVQAFPFGTKENLPDDWTAWR